MKVFEEEKHRTSTKSFLLFMCYVDVESVYVRLFNEILLLLTYILH